MILINLYSNQDFNGLLQFRNSRVFDDYNLKKLSDSYGVIHVYVKLWWGFTNPSNVISFVQLWPHSNRWTHSNVIGGK